jgi:hypothetical protein
MKTPDELCEELRWRAQTREVLEVEVGHRVCDYFRPSGKLTHNIMPSGEVQPTAGPIRHIEEDIDTNFHTLDVDSIEAGADE